ncbi:serine/threonine-protein kinase pdik1l-B-like [Haliotis cracherodii]|uniref:serine/threonine-protein kinase pdik1l-B-like n=1 Tax=Haliotis cracherodii TaxID=6455 RepID=UPI0039E7A945
MSYEFITPVFTSEQPKMATGAFNPGYIKYGKLGEGQFGVVYKVMAGGQLYALKKLKKMPDLDRNALEKEIRTLHMCSDHPNIVKMITTWIDDEIAIQMEYCNLGTLNDYLIENRQGERILGSFMLDMARGLRHLHRKKFIHRDIKPDNILLVARPGYVPICKIADVGLARLTFPTSGNTTTISYTYYMTTGLCTPLYASPEVFSGQYTTACDIFSLGVVFYAMHCLQTFHVGNKTFLYPVIPQSNGMMHRVSQEEIASAVAMHVSNRQKASLVRSMLSLEPRARPRADAVESTISSYESTHYSCSLV